MARFLRIWEKKRGRRQTGSPLVGSLGEAIFFGLMFLLGIILSTILITTQVIRADQPTAGGFWVMVMVMGSFIVLGGGGLLYTVLDMGVSAERRSALRKKATDIELMPEAPPARDFPNVPSDTNLTNSPGITLAYRLPSSQSPAWALLAASSFFLIWTSITAILAYVAIQRSAQGESELLLNLSLIPFVGVAIWASRYLWQQIRLQMGIGPTHVEVSDHPLLPGNKYRVFLSQVGRLEVESLEVLLMCEEQATFRHGTDVRTEYHPVHRQLILRRENFDIESGLPFEQEFDLPIPAHAMHSFQGSHNAVHWKLLVRGVVRRWPTFERSFPLVVLPPAPNQEVANGPTD